MNAFDLATLVFRAAIIAPGKALSTKPAGGSGDLTFSRAGSADRINAQGDTETMGPNKLRIDYRFPLDGDNSCTGVPIAPVALVQSAEGEVLSISDLVAGGFTFDDCTVFYVDNFQRVVKVYTSDGNCKTWVDGNEIGTVVEAKPDSLSWPAGDYSTLQQLVIIRVALSDAEALALSENTLLDTYSQTYLSAYVQLLVNGYSVESATRTLTYGLNVDGLFAEGFRTFLAPGTGKAGSVSFIKYSELGGDIVLPGELIEADFSRPDVGADSGAIVINEAGELVELNEDVLDLSYPSDGGYPLILMRPQQANYNDTNNFTYTNYNGTSGVLTPNFGTFSGFPTMKIAFTDNTAKRSFFKVISVPIGKIATGFWVRSLSGDQEIAHATGGGLAIYSKVTVGETWQWIEGSVDFIGGVSLSVTRGIGYVTTTGEFEIALHTLSVGEYLGWAIPGAALTRAANQITFEDLVTKGVCSAAGFSVCINLKNYRYLTDVDACVFRDDVSTVFSLVSDGSTSFQVSAGGTDIGTIHDEPVIITFNGTDLKLYKQSGLVGQVVVPLAEVDNVQFGTGNGCNYDFEGIYFSASVLTESQAINALGQL